jgi:hypothetical protein
MPFGIIPFNIGRIPGNIRPLRCNISDVDYSIQEPFHTRTIRFPGVPGICYLVFDKGIAGVAELVDAADLKSAEAWLRAGSSPAPGIRALPAAGPFDR